MSFAIPTTETISQFCHHEELILLKLGKIRELVSRHGKYFVVKTLTIGN